MVLDALKHSGLPRFTSNLAYNLLSQTLFPKVFGGSAYSGHCHLEHALARAKTALPSRLQRLSEGRRHQTQAKRLSAIGSLSHVEDVIVVMTLSVSHCLVHLWG